MGLTTQKLKNVVPAKTNLNTMVVNMVTSQSTDTGTNQNTIMDTNQSMTTDTKNNTLSTVEAMAITNLVMEVDMDIKLNMEATDLDTKVTHRTTTEEVTKPLCMEVIRRQTMEDIKDMECHFMVI